jgi:murein DD-endopeptidase MepM/ murein hydrolase activator NlpD
MKYLGLGLLMLLVCFMCLIFLAPGDDLALYDSVNLYNTRSNIARGNTIALRNVSVDTGTLFEMTGASIRVAGATADMGVFPMEVQAGDSIIITSTYMQRFSNNPHGGIDFCVAGKPGSWIIATRDGLVTRVYAGCGKTSRGRTCNGPHTESFGLNRCSGLGNYVVITHSDGTKSLYAHLKPGSVEVSPGQVVHAAQRLGIEGTSGSSDGVHLHYTIYGSKHTSSVANFADVYASAIAGDQLAKETLFSVGGTHASYNSARNGLSPDTELANVYLSTRVLYETVIRDAGTSDPFEIREWGRRIRSRNNYIAILCVGGENSLEGSYTNSNLWRPFG